MPRINAMYPNKLPSYIVNSSNFDWLLFFKNIVIYKNQPIFIFALVNTSEKSYNNDNFIHQ